MKFKNIDLDSTRENATILNILFTLKNSEKTKNNLQFKIEKFLFILLSPLIST